MSNAENDTPENTPISSNGLNGSPKGTDPIVPSPGQLQDPFLVPSSTPTRTSSYPSLRVMGGDLASITKGITDDIAGGGTAETREATLHFLQSNANGFVGALAMRCKGKDCPILDSCPLFQTNAALPLGKPCPFEAGIVQTWVNKHLMSLGIEDFSAPESSFDLDLLYELAAHELIKWKAAHHLSKAGKLIEDRQVAANMQGDAIFAEVVSPALEILDIHNKITMKLRDALLATRKAQIQAGRDMADPSKKASELAEMARKKALKRLNRVNEKIKDAEFDVKDN